MSSKNEKKAKRTMSWSQLLLPSYKTRLIEFRKQFKAIPSNERLIADFACALQKEILIQGRIYLSVNYLAFHANIFGWETIVTLKLCDITALTKANTIRVIPNAIQVITNNGNKYIFTSFVARDKAFKRIYRLWQDITIGQKMNVSDVWQLIHYNYGSELGVPSDLEENEEELSLVARNNSRLRITEEDINDEVFEENIPIGNQRHDSISSFLTCPESEIEEELNYLTSDDVKCIGHENVCIKCHKSHKLSKLKCWFSTYPRESMYIRLLLLLSLLLLFMHFILLYKFSKVDLPNYVNIDQLKQLADLTSRLVRETN
jgi:hypothetical protein